MLGTSEHMLWIQSMPRVPYAYLQMPICWSWLVMPMIVYVCIHLGIGYFKARGVKNPRDWGPGHNQDQKGGNLHQGKQSHS